MKKCEELMAIRTLIFDIEANGEANPRVCQLACIMVGGGQPDARNYYFCVESMNKYACKVHGLSVQRLRELSGGRTFADSADEICRYFYWADVYAGHGVAGDIDYLRREFERLRRCLPERRRFCTMSFFTGAIKATLPDGSPKPPSLAELRALCGLDDAQVGAVAERLFGGGSSAHDARFDAAATYMILQHGVGAV